MQAKLSRPRQILLVLFALALLIGGGYLLFEALQHPNIYSVLRGVGVAAVLMGLGVYLLWDDFVKPRLESRKR